MCNREPLIKSTMNRVAIKNEMIARRTTKVVVDVRSQGVQQRNRRGHARQVPATLWRPWRHKHSFLMQPLGFDLMGTTALRAVCGVRLLVKGMAINFVALLASHPAKPLSRPCGT